MKGKLKNVFGIVLILMLVSVSGCSAVSNEDANIEDQSNTTEIKNTDSIGEYMKEIDKTIPNFEPYYRIVFAFENLPNGVASIPFSKVDAMYKEIRESFDYVIVGEQSLSYRGDYMGNTCFVDSYERYEEAQKSGSDKARNPINVTAHDWDGNEFLSTDLKTVMLGEDTFSRFNDSVIEGRNLHQQDFVLKKSTEPIKAVLGSNYRDIYKIGDILTLDLISKPMTFEVVGFYKPGLSLSMDVGAQNKINFDNTIVIPHLFFDYEPVGEDEIYQHSFLAGEKLSGYIKIQEKTADIDESTFDEYSNAIKNIADKYEISDLYKLPYRPVGFVWKDLNQQ